MMMTTEVKYWTFVWLLCGFCIYCTMADDTPEFQYPCYIDVCTFPREFCNSNKNERRCSPCSVYLCKKERIPLACKYQCNKLKNPNFPGQVEHEHFYVDKAWFAVSLAELVVCIALILLILYKKGYVRLACRRTKINVKRTDPETTSLVTGKKCDGEKLKNVCPTQRSGDTLSNSNAPIITNITRLNEEHTDQSPDDVQQPTLSGGIHSSPSSEDSGTNDVPST